MFKVLIMEYCLFILGIYGVQLFKFICVLAKKEKVKYFLFMTILFFTIRMSFAIL